MKEHLIQLLDYERWANRRIIDALETLDAPPTRAVAVMGHILSAQHVWFGRIVNETVFVSIWEDIPVSWMAETVDRQHKHLLDYLTTSTDEDLTRTAPYTDFQGHSYESRLSDILTHISHHAAYHRGQIVQLIRPLLKKAPVTDYIVWIRETGLTA